jgi:hypothetical protein
VFAEREMGEEEGFVDIVGGESDEVREEGSREEAGRAREDASEPVRDGTGETPNRTAEGPGSAGHPLNQGEAAASGGIKVKEGGNLRKGLIEEVEAVRDRVKELTCLEDPTTEERAEMLRHAEKMAVLAQEMTAVAEKHEQKVMTVQNGEGAEFGDAQERENPPADGGDGEGSGGKERTKVNKMGESYGGATVNGEDEGSVLRSSGEFDVTGRGGGGGGGGGDADGNGEAGDKEDEERALERKMSRLLNEIREYEKEQERDSMEKSARIR